MDTDTPLEDRVVAAIGGDIGPRFTIIHGFFVRHLFAFARDVGLTVDDFVPMTHAIIKLLCISTNRSPPQ